MDEGRNESRREGKEIAREARGKWMLPRCSVVALNFRWTCGGWYLCKLLVQPHTHPRLPATARPGLFCPAPHITETAAEIECS